MLDRLFLHPAVKVKKAEPIQLYHRGCEGRFTGKLWWVSLPAGVGYAYCAGCGGSPPGDEQVKGLLPADLPRPREETPVPPKASPA